MLNGKLSLPYTNDGSVCLCAARAQVPPNCLCSFGCIHTFPYRNQRSTGNMGKVCMPADSRQRLAYMIFFGHPHCLDLMMSRERQRDQREAHQPSTMFLMPASFRRPVGPSWTATSFITRSTSSSGISSRPFLFAAAGSTCATHQECLPT